MKTQRRHELQTNVLADWLGHQIEQIRPYSKFLLGAAIAIALVAVFATYIRNDQAARLSAGWSDFYAASFAQSPDNLRSVAEQHAGTEASLWALLGEADLALARALGELYTDRESAQRSFRRAQESYEMVERSSSDRPQLLQAAQFGLAQLYESRNKLDEARRYYKKVAAHDNVRGREAQRRLEQLNNDEIEEFYEWFAQYEPPPPAAPADTPESSLPDIGDLPNLNDLPTRPDFTVPSMPPSSDADSTDSDTEGELESGSAPPEESDSTDDPPAEPENSESAEQPETAPQ